MPASRIRSGGLIFEVDPQMAETVKWRNPTNPDGILVWEHAGMVCGGGVQPGEEVKHWPGSGPG